MLKRLFTIFIMLFVSADISNAVEYDFNLPLSGDSIANDTLQYNVLKQIYSDSIKEYPACTDFKIKNTQIVHYPYDVVKKKDKYIKGYWKEIWTLNACNSTFQVPLTFIIHKNNTDFIIEK